MARSDTFGNRCDRTVRVHIRQVHNMKVDVGQSVRCAQKLYGKYGILFEVPTNKSLSMDLSSLTRLAVTDTECKWDESSADQAELFARFGISDWSSITAFFVQLIEGTKQPVHGCAGHAPHRPAVFIQHDAPVWGLAHEVGHVLLSSTFEPGHSATPTNIMHDWSQAKSTISDPRFTSLQLLQIRKSPYLLPC